MPTYAYACKDCGHRFDAAQSFADPALTDCPVCGGALKKEYGSIGVTFNGSGFYRTDSRAAPSGEKAGGQGGDSGGGAGDGGSTSGAGAKSSGGDAKTPTSSDSSGSKTPAPSTTGS